MKTGISEIENIEKIKKKFNAIKSWVFEKINRINNLLARLTKKKRRDSIY